MQAGDQLHQGRLATAGGTDDGGELTLGNAHREAGHGERAVRPAIAHVDVVDGYEMGHCLLLFVRALGRLLPAVV